MITVEFWVIRALLTMNFLVPESKQPTKKKMFLLKEFRRILLKLIKSQNIFLCIGHCPFIKQNDIGMRCVANLMQFMVLANIQFLIHFTTRSIHMQLKKKHLHQHVNHSNYLRIPSSIWGNFMYWSNFIAVLSWVVCLLYVFIAEHIQWLRVKVIGYAFYWRADPKNWRIFVRHYENFQAKKKIKRLAWSIHAIWTWFFFPILLFTFFFKCMMSVS